MTRSGMRTLLPAALTLALLAPAALAAVSVGDKAPDWSGIVGVDGKKHSLADYGDAKALVLVFTCNHCPVAKAYEDRLIELQKDYQSKGVQVVAVCVNSPKKQPQDSLDKMRERAEEKDFNFPYIQDPSQKMGRDYGAKVTPHVYVLDAKRNVAYVGAIDDNMNADAVETKYVRDALDAVLAGKKPATTETKAQGCGIKWD